MRAYAIFVLGAMTAAALSSQTLTVLYSFDNTDGAYPFAGLVQAISGDLYGTTSYGGARAGGTIFKITPGGTLTTLRSLCSKTGCTDGYYPLSGLVQATNGEFYGTMPSGGANGTGTVFKITPSGALTTLYSFCAESSCTDGADPEAALVQAYSGDLYGTTAGGGDHGEGTVFKMTPGGMLTAIYSFCSQTNCADGSSPEAALIQANNGDLYGTTFHGGIHGWGTVFKITPEGALPTLHSFCSQPPCMDGAEPKGALVQAANGDLYGTTMGGGSNGGGTVFKITPGGTLTTLHRFRCCADGIGPPSGLVEGADGNFYGITFEGGANPGGTIFKITPSGTLTTLYSFCAQTNCTDGNGPIGALIQATNGDFYGTTKLGGANNDGTVFRLTVGQRQGVRIHGGAVLRSNTTVAAGATPSGTLSSNVPFRLLP
jgi:uncharacterized repeat protein (TIGR03803 family)